MKILLHPGYFLNIVNFAVIAKYNIVWEQHDNYQKQTFRNRTYICTDHGKHILSIPIKHVGNKQGKQKYNAVKIDNDYPWQRQHWRTLETAYRTSPFFEFYEDEIAPLYKKEFTSLIDFNLATISCISDCLQMEIPQQKTETFEAKPTTLIDGRILISAKQKLSISYEKYVQVFNDRNGFIPNTSILDLLFNEGPNALPYLQRINLDFIDA